ncbi:MAG: flagellar biosynthesis protein FlgE [Gammaproteobacteria bacterium]|nr:MAG: flagellar biosynthesis protein FlgE [Gammaproteobacteria bacterium]
MINSVLGSGLYGIQKGYSTMNQAADKIAKAGSSLDPSADLTESAVALQQSKIQVQASAKVLETADKTIGSLIDIKV